MAASIPVPQAAAELNAAIAAANATLSYRYQETGWNGAQAAYNAAGQYEENHYSFGHHLVFESTRSSGDPTRSRTRCAVT